MADTLSWHGTIGDYVHLTCDGVGRQRTVEIGPPALAAMPKDATIWSLRRVARCKACDQPMVVQVMRPQPRWCPDESGMRGGLTPRLAPLAGHRVPPSEANVIALDRFQRRR